MTLPNGPTVCVTVCVFVSATDSSGECSPARYARLPSREYAVLCAPESVTIFLMMLPSRALMTCQ